VHTHEGLKPWPRAYQIQSPGPRPCQALPTALGAWARLGRLRASSPSLHITINATADRFGSNPECNQNTVAVIFRPFSALKSGRIFGWIVVSLAFMCYTAMTARDYTSQILKKVRKWEDTRTADEATPLPQQQCPVPEFTPPKIPTARKISQRQVRWLFVWLSK